MKRWQSITVHVLLVVAAALAKEVPQESIREPLVALIAGVAAMSANSTSKSNPDGSPAEKPWQK